MYFIRKLLSVALTLVLTLGTSYVHAKSYTFNEALELYSALKLTKVKPEPDGRIQTLNRKGAASPVLDEATLAFLDYAQGKQRVLEIGGAYGKVMQKALEGPVDIEYHLNDIDSRHLFIAADNLKQAGINDKTLRKTQFIDDNVNTLHVDKPYDAILIARVLHFLSPEDLDAAIPNLYQALNPGGKIFVVAITPYVKRYQAFIPEYERRLAKGEAYPGFVHSLKDWLNTEVTSNDQMSKIAQTPFMFMDPIVLTTLFKQAGFLVLEAKTVPLKYQSTSWSLDGRENVILIAQRPTSE